CLDGRLRVEGQAEQVLVVAGGEVDRARVGRGVGGLGSHGRAKDGHLQGEQRHGGSSWWDGRGLPEENTDGRRGNKGPSPPGTILYTAAPRPHHLTSSTR